MTKEKDKSGNEALTKFGQSRRNVALGGAAAIGATLIGAPAIVRAQSKQPIKVSVGRIPWAAGNSPVTQYMINNKLFEKRAAEQGYDVTIDWRDYPTAMPMVTTPDTRPPVTSTSRTCARADVPVSNAPMTPSATNVLRMCGFKHEVHEEIEGHEADPVQRKAATTRAWT